MEKAESEEEQERQQVPSSPNETLKEESVGGKEVMTSPERVYTFGKLKLRGESDDLPQYVGTQVLLQYGVTCGC